MNRKEFLSLLILSALAPNSAASYDTAKKKTNPKNPIKNREMNYILFNLYESPPRWLFDLPLRPLESSKFLSSPMIATKFENNLPVYRTVALNNYQMPSLLENDIPTSSAKSVKISELFKDAIIIHGCNMNKDGHDVNSKALEASAEGRVSIGGAIAETSTRPFKAISVNGIRADVYKGVISSFRTPKGIKATNCDDNDIQYIKQVLEVFESKSRVNSRETVDTFLKALGKELKEDNSYHYHEIDKLSQLPFEDIYKDFSASLKKYHALSIKAHRDHSIRGVTDVTTKGIQFPATYKLNESKSTSALDYMGKYQMIENILTQDNLQDIFRDIDFAPLAERFALIEVALKYELTNVLLINIDPFQNLKIKGAAPNRKITHTIKEDMITFDFDKENAFTTSREKNLEFTSDAHYIGTYPALIGYSKLYQIFSTCLLELKTFLKKSGLDKETLIHITSEFERSPQDNEAGSDHGWRGHTSTFMHGRIEEFAIIGNIKHSSSNILRDHYCTWGEADENPHLNRQLRYGDIVTSIAKIFNVSSTDGGVSLINISKGGVIRPRFKETL